MQFWIFVFYIFLPFGSIIDTNVWDVEITGDMIKNMNCCCYKISITYFKKKNVWQRRLSKRFLDKVHQSCRNLNSTFCKREIICTIIHYNWLYTYEKTPKLFISPHLEADLLFKICLCAYGWTLRCLSECLAVHCFPQLHFVAGGLKAAGLIFISVNWMEWSVPFHEVQMMPWHRDTHLDHQTEINPK